MTVGEFLLINKIFFHNIIPEKNIYQLSITDSLILKRLTFKLNKSRKYCRLFCTIAIIFLRIKIRNFIGCEIYVLSCLTTFYVVNKAKGQVEKCSVNKIKLATGLWQLFEKVVTGSEVIMV